MSEKKNIKQPDEKKGNFHSVYTSIQFKTEIITMFYHSNRIIITGKAERETH